MKSLKYTFTKYSNKDGSKEWLKTPQFRKAASIEYLYLVIRDKDYPHGRVLLSSHPPEDEHERHEQLLKRHKYVMDYSVKDDSQRQTKIADGYTILNHKTDIIEVGAIRYDGEGIRYDFSRTRWNEQGNAHDRRRTIDLVYTRIKKHLNQVALQEMKRMEAGKKASEKLALIYAPVNAEKESRQVIILPDNTSFQDFLKEQSMLPYRVFAIARFNPQASSVEEMKTFAPYAYLDSENRDMVSKAMSSSTLTSHILNKLWQAVR